jgi:transcriptional regulator with XRE-family HTH domain
MADEARIPWVSRIRRRRLRRGWSAGELAARALLNRETVVSIELAKVEPNRRQWSTIYRLAEAFGDAPDDIYVDMLDDWEERRQLRRRVAGAPAASAEVSGRA